MANAEIILNLWYTHDDAGFIYSLRARAYIGTGTDDEKLAMLHRLANIDYLIAGAFPIPERFHIEIEEGGNRRRMPVAPRECLNDLVDSSIAIWEDTIKQIEAELPGQTTLRIPEEPRFCSTGLLMDDAGRLFSGRRLLRLSRKGDAIEVVESTWAPIIALLRANGWRPSPSADSFLADGESMSDEDALALSHTGQDILVQVLKDPLSVQIHFDLEKFAALVDFASAGGFRISRSG